MRGKNLQCFLFSLGKGQISYQSNNISLHSNVIRLVEMFQLPSDHFCFVVSLESHLSGFDVENAAQQNESYLYLVMENAFQHLRTIMVKMTCIKLCLTEHTTTLSGLFKFWDVK